MDSGDRLQQVLPTHASVPSRKHRGRGLWGRQLQEQPGVPLTPPDPSRPSTAMANSGGQRVGMGLSGGCNQGLQQHWPFIFSKWGAQTNSSFHDEAAKILFKVLNQRM